MTGRLTLTLPGRWFEVPLEAAELDDRLRDFVRDLLGSHDAAARSRALLLRRLQDAAGRARRAKAEQLHLGLALTDDVPLPAVITVHRAVPVVTAGSAAAKDVMDALLPAVIGAETVPAGGDPVPGVDDRVFTDGDRMILRKPRLRFGTDDEPPALLIDYWLTIPGQARAELVQVSMPEALHTELFAVLFDEIVFAARRAARPSILDGS